MIWYAEQYNQTESAEGNSGLRPFCIPTPAGSFIRDSKMSKLISLTQGQFAIVDNEDFEWLNQHKWYARWNIYTKSYYAMRSKWTNGKACTIHMAREILGLSRDDKRQSDHIDHNTLNNRRVNLRIVTRNQNQWNRKSPKGYYFHKTNQKYQAQIKLNGKVIYLGCFHTTEEAHSAYLEAKKHYHKINF